MVTFEELCAVWGKGATHNPETGCFYRSFDTDYDAAQLVVWIVDDAVPLNDSMPESVGHDSAMVLAAIWAALKHRDVSKVIACHHTTFVIDHISGKVLKTELAQQKVSLFLDLYGPGDSDNLGRELAPKLVAGENETHLAKIPWSQAAVFTKKGDGETGNRLKYFIVKPYQIVDVRGLEQLCQQTAEFIDGCVSLKRSRFQRAAGEKMLCELAKTCKDFHDPNEKHELRQLLDLANKQELASVHQASLANLATSIAKGFATINNISAPVCKSLFLPFTDGETIALGIDLETFFALSKSLSLRFKMNGNYLPGYWIRSILGTNVDNTLDRWAIKLNDCVPVSGVLASFEELKTRSEFLVSNGIFSFDANLTEFSFEFKIRKDENSDIQNLLELVADKIRNPVFSAESHSIPDAVTSLIMAGFTVDLEVELGEPNNTIRWVLIRAKVRSRNMCTFLV
jgi:hypothetical protein